MYKKINNKTTTKINYFKYLFKNGIHHGSKNSRKTITKTDIDFMLHIYYSMECSTIDVIFTQKT